MFVKINTQKIKIKSVITPKQISKGMMGKKFDDSFEGMLFFMNDYDNHCFWMKNCITSLDIVFIEDDTITKIYKNCDPCNEDECKHYCGYGNFVLELDGGYCDRNNIEEGDIVEYIF